MWVTGQLLGAKWLLDFLWPPLFADFWAGEAFPVWSAYEILVYLAVSFLEGRDNKSVVSIKWVGSRATVKGGLFTSVQFLEALWRNSGKKLGDTRWSLNTRFSCGWIPRILHMYLGSFFHSFNFIGFLVSTCCTAIAPRLTSVKYLERQIVFIS